MRLFALFLCVFFYSYGQKNVQTIRIDNVLNEISGLEQFNDSILVAVNDSGNDAVLYFLDFKGHIIKKTQITNAKNNDWEDLTIDDQRNLYIGDFGNNMNTRKNLAVLKVNIDEAFANDSISVAFIHFSYEEQKAFPPIVGERIFDCESMAWKNGKLMLITKNTDKRAKESKVYSLSPVPGTYSLKSINVIESNGKLKNQFTSIDCDNNKLYLLSYKQFSNGIKTVRFKRLTQKEALVVLGDGNVIIASERNIILGGPYFHFINNNKHLSD